MPAGINKQLDRANLSFQRYCWGSSNQYLIDLSGELVEEYGDGSPPQVGNVPRFLSEEIIRLANDRDRIRTELTAWLIGDIDPRDAGLINGRRIVDEIDRICQKE